ncbi:hypothetical protein KKC62_03410 [Patescibacteria group bacterium]|nr:hypothetical protein [Patescibacteria group bacterium]MBU1953224.1 hypothetical protein [Patescibacteria group bacterium]
MKRTLPKNFDKYFWDVHTDKLSVDENYPFIIERLLELGDLEELAWVNNNYSKEKIAKTLCKSRRISPKTGNFFSLYYKIPKSSLLACTKKRLV